MIMMLSEKTMKVSQKTWYTISRKSRQECCGWKTEIYLQDRYTVQNTVWTTSGSVKNIRYRASRDIPWEHRIIFCRESWDSARELGRQILPTGYPFKRSNDSQLHYYCYLLHNSTIHKKSWLIQANSSISLFNRFSENSSTESSYINIQVRTY